VLVRVNDAEVVNATIRIEPAVVYITTLFGDAVLPHADIEVHNQRGGWKTKIHSDNNGYVEAELWQRGTFAVGVSSLPTVRIWTASKEISGQGGAQWELRVPDRRIRGQVLDAQSGLPVRDARVLLQTGSLDDNTLFIPVISDS